MRNLVSFSIFIVLCLFIQVNEVQSKKAVEMIPDEAIRLRILANSDTSEDQKTKLVVRDQVSFYISDLVKDIDNIDEARTIIEQHIPQVAEVVQRTLVKEQAPHSFTVEYRKNVPFPEKMYGNYLYPEGEYEAVLITIGKAEGANWWCVLFPPLCFLDFSSKENSEEKVDEDKGIQADEQEDVNSDQQNSDLEDNRIKKEMEVIENNEVDSKEDESETKISFFLLEWLGWS